MTRRIFSRALENESVGDFSWRWRWMEIFDEGKTTIYGKLSQDENFSGIAPGKIPLTRRTFLRCFRE
ncbi:MAG: hypothetical protein F6K22_14125 [Okeania sp. SIO2F4]|uniref:hypothetical protein n=1 Tax=Okeania sp. SIO2F4 TaxID=2607790 RepID=UPI00142B1080|nr:hypothetical protein [Okeania sp. SIO2F4]NES03878.1 hypothetical protein [Okeania sp. SIO2F4]